MLNLICRQKRHFRHPNRCPISAKNLKFKLFKGEVLLSPKNHQQSRLGQTGTGTYSSPHNDTLITKTLDRNTLRHPYRSQKM